MTIDNEVLTVTKDGEFIWHDDADRLIEEEKGNNLAMYQVLKRLREWRPVGCDGRDCNQGRNCTCGEFK
jgi:hypothetical protein